MNQHALFAAHVAPKTNAWLRQARSEITACQHPSSANTKRLEWHGVARGLHLANAINTEAHELMKRSIDVYTIDHIDSLKTRAAANRVDEE